MKLIKLTALAVLMAFGVVMAQEVEKKIELKIMVDGDGTDGPHEMHWVSDDLDLEDLAVGESKTITGESGREVTVTRTVEGMQFDIEGETIVVPDMGAHGTHMAFVDADGAHGDVDVRVMKMDGNHEDIDIEVIGGGAHMMQAHHPDGVTIISGTPLDDSVRDSIRSVLISAGNNEEVTFIDGSGDGKQVKVIKRQIQITE
jgi:hypothetical protein